MHFRVFVFTSQFVCFGGKRKLWWFLVKFSNAYLKGSTKFNCFKIVANDARTLNNLTVTKHCLKSFECKEIFCFQICVDSFLCPRPLFEIGSKCSGYTKGFLK